MVKQQSPDRFPHGLLLFGFLILFFDLKHTKENIVALYCDVSCLGFYFQELNEYTVDTTFLFRSQQADDDDDYDDDDDGDDDGDD